MKNLHLIPTDKPSTLFKDAFDKYFISINIDREQNHFKPQYIYITSDEEIKVGDWYCSPYGIISKHNGTEMLPDYWKKIILTTDQDLIADGIQAINEEFLEWFVKNSNCESVDVVKCRGYLHLSYMIMIPQEEPKQETIEEELWGNVFAKIKQYGLNYEVLTILKQNFNISKR